MKLFSIYCFIKHHKRNIIISALISIFLLIAGYFANNLSIFTGESIIHYGWLQSIKEIIGIDNDNYEDAVFIDIAYNQDIIPYKKNLGNGEIDTIGTINIINRTDLYNLLTILKSINYKYIILDVAFIKGLDCDKYIINADGDTVNIDDALFNLIKSMDRIVIPEPNNAELSDTSLYSKSAKAYFNSTISTTNFLRYKFFDKRSFVPLKVYNDLCNHKGLDTVKCNYPIYTQGNRLCYNSLFIDFKISDICSSNSFSLGSNSSAISDYIKILNQDILYEDQFFTREEVLNGFKAEWNDKYIIIGDFSQNDLHDTYAGKKPGPFILYKAIKALDQNKHLVPLTSIIILFIIYFSISFCILTDNRIIKFITVGNNGYLRYIADILSFTLIFWLYNSIEYMIGRVSFSFVFPAFIFASMKTYITIQNRYKMKRSIILIFVAILFGFLLSSFCFKTTTRDLVIHRYSSNSIKIDGNYVCKNMQLDINSKIQFPSKNDYILVKAIDDIKYNDEKGRENIWHKATTKKIYPIKNIKDFNLAWWYNEVTTYTKGAFTNEIYAISDTSAVEVYHPILDPHKQYYNFEIVEGICAGKIFEARNDDKNQSLIWLLKEDMENIFDCNTNQTFKCKMNFVNYRVITESRYVILHYIVE